MKDRQTVIELARKAWKDSSTDTDILELQHLSPPEAKLAQRWELLRHLFFREQFPESLQSAVESGSWVSVPRPQGDTLARMIRFKRFPLAGWWQLREAEKSLLSITSTKTSAATLTPSDRYHQQELARWLLTEISSKPLPSLNLPRTGRTAHFARKPPPMQHDRDGDGTRCQLVLEVDLTQGKEDIEKALTFAISPLWAEHHASGRKGRGSSDSFKGLILARRKDVRGLQWKEARIDLYDSDKSLKPSGAASKAYEATKHELERMTQALATPVPEFSIEALKQSLTTNRPLDPLMLAELVARVPAIGEKIRRLLEHEMQ